jgi:YihY family inner membrane protein
MEIIRIINGMNIFQKATAKIDAFQQKHPVSAFPIAVAKRYGDDKVGKQAALITYYGFLALFPLLLIFITVIGIIVSGDPVMQDKINHQVFQIFPALGNDLQGNVHTLKGSGIALVLEILILSYGARGLANSLQEAFNHVWHTDKTIGSNFIVDNLRNISMMISVAVGIVVGTVVTYAVAHGIDLGLGTTVLLTLINLAVTILLFLAVFRLGTSSHIKTSSLVLGAIISGIGLLIIQHFGNLIMAHELPRLRGTYGSFALALGMMFWIYLQAQIIMYALVITAVRVQKDWPKKLF